MHAAVCEQNQKNEYFEGLLKDGKPIEVCFNEIWYPATVVRKKGLRLIYRLEQRAERILGKKKIFFWRKPIAFTYPKGHQGELMIRYGENVRARTI